MIHRYMLHHASWQRRCGDQLGASRGIARAVGLSLLLWIVLACALLAGARLAHAQVPVPDGPVVTGTITNTQSVAITANGKCSFGYAISGTWTGTITLEAQDQSGAWNTTTAVPANATAISSFTANSGGQGSIAGFKAIRFRGNTVATGTATITLTLSNGCATIMSDNPLQVTQSGTWTVQLGPQPACTKVIPINQTASTDLYTASFKVRICSVTLVSATQQGLSLAEGTGSVCGTGTAFLMGGAGGTMQVAANGGLALAAATPFVETQTSADHLCLIQSGVGNVSGMISYSDGLP